MSGINPNRPTPTTPRTAPTQTQPAQAPRPQQTQQQQPPARPLAQTSGSAGYETGSAFEARTSGTLPGGIQAEAYARGPSFSVNGNADAQVSRNGIDVNLSVDINATLAEAGANATRTFRVDVAGEQLDITVDLAAQGRVGADGRLNLNLHIGTDGRVAVNAGAEGFAGARGSITGGVRVQHEGRELASGSLELSGSAGVSGNAHLNVGLSNGRLTFDVGAEATAGVGFGVQANGSVHGGNSARFAGEVLVSAGRQRLEDARDFIRNRIPNIDLNPFN
jgi:hypothetical protein